VTANAWRVQFTDNFRRDLIQLSKSCKVDWLSRLEALREGPLVRSNNIKPLKGLSKAFRWRFGDIRVVYRALVDSKLILLLKVAHRRDVYRTLASGESHIAGDLDEIPNLVDKNQQIAPQPTTHRPLPEDSAEQEEASEEILLDETELYLLGIHKGLWTPILECRTVQDLERIDLPDSTLQRLFDYLTAPGEHQIGRLYALSEADEFGAIATQPLGAFMVALDPVQKAVVDKPLTKGPFLVRGGPGTGKTLVHVARIKQAFEQRSYDTLFSASARIGFITFNKTLAQTAESMLLKLLPKPNDLRIEFRTLDSLVLKVLSKTRCRNWGLCSDSEFKTWVIRAINELKADSQRATYLNEVLSRRSIRFLSEEIESVIIGNELSQLESYFELNRQGRKVSLRRKERTLIWDLYLKIRRIAVEKRKLTFAMRRSAALKALRSGEADFEPFDALFVDELQDLSVVGIRFLEHLVSHPEHMNLAADTAQSIYVKAPSWSDISANLRFHRGNSFVLRKSYRMTRQISNAIAPLRNVAADESDDAAEATDCPFSGPRPAWLSRQQPQHAIASAELTWEVIQELNINPGQVAVVTHDKKDRERVLDQLREADVPATIVDRDSRIDLDGQHVHLITAHSAKGLEFPIVIVPWVVEGTYPDQRSLSSCIDQDERDEVYELHKKLLYVALSRAARRLYMITDAERPSPFLKELDANLWDTSTH